MVTIKSYTDLSQSKRLAEILPLESADMYYYDKDAFTRALSAFNGEVLIRNSNNELPNKTTPAWSFAALFSILPNNYIDVDDTVKQPSLMKTKHGRYMVIYSAFQYSSLCNNPVDACYDMIIRLHELNLL